VEALLFFSAIQKSDLMAPVFVRPLDSKKGIDRQSSYLYSLLSGSINPFSAESNKKQRRVPYLFLASGNRKQYNRHRRQGGGVSLG
jgi:hypothetical protein